MNYYKIPFWKTKFFYFLLIILVTGIGFVWWSINRPASIAEQNANNNTESILISENIKPTLTLKEGKVRLLINGNEQEISADQNIPIGSTIKTFLDSNVEIKFGNVAIIRLDDSTEFEIIEAKNNNIKIKQISGKAYYRINKNAVDFNLKTKDLSITTMDSIFNLDLENKSEILVIDGSITAEVNLDGIPLNYYSIEQGNKGYKSGNNIELSKIQEPKELLEIPWIQWNYDRDITQGLTAGIISGQSIPKEIILNAYTQNKVIHLDWKLEDGEALEGFRILMSEENKEPTYPEDQNHFIKNTDARNDVWKDLELEKTYNFRIGIYDGTSGILKYSNSVSILLTENDDANITLSAKTDGNKIDLSWTSTNIPSDALYNIVIAEEQDPVYPTNTSQKVSTNSYTWDSLDINKTYNFRVCVIIDDSCNTYSNNVTSEFTESNGTIVLSAQRINTSAQLNWSMQDITAEQGYQILMSENPNPTIQNSEIKRINSRAVNSYTWDNLEVSKTYYFTLCEYKGDNTCGIFSNTISIEIPKPNTPSNSGNISLSAIYTFGKIHANWTESNLDEHSGFYVILSETASPTPSVNNFHTTDNQTLFDSWTVESGKTYYIRVCAYQNNACTTYSNQLTIKTI